MVLTETRKGGVTGLGKGKRTVSFCDGEVDP